jgi:hypothetical protein
MENLLAWGLGALTTMVGGGVGLYLGAYLKKKGENLATQEDVDKLVEQVQAVTTTTKEIEAKVSGEVWNRQRRWELKRNVLLEGAKKFGAWVDAFFALGTAYMADSAQLRKGQAGNIDERGRRGEKWHELTKEFVSTQLLISLVCGEELARVLSGLAELTNKVEVELAEGNPDAAMQHSEELGNALKAVSVAFRKELGFDVGA